MTAAVTSSTSATYVAPAAASTSASEADTAQQGNATAAPAVATPAANPSSLAPSTVAALVAQQAADSGSASTDPTASPSASDPAASANSAAANHVQIPQAVLDNMKAFQTTAPTAYTGQIQQYAATINDSKAADADKLNAWTSLNTLLYSGTVYQAGNVADYQTALDATQTSDYAKSLMQLQHQFVATNTSAVAAAKANGEAGVQGMVDALNSYSDADQQKIFVLFGMNQQYSDVATLKADDQNIANGYASTGQLAKATMQLSGGKSAAASTPASSQAAASLLDANPTQTTADVALTLLKNGAAAQTAAKANDAAGAKSGGSSTNAPGPGASQKGSTNPDQPFAGASLTTGSSNANAA